MITMKCANCETPNKIKIILSEKKCDKCGEYLIKKVNENSFEVSSTMIL